MPQSKKKAATAYDRLVGARIKARREELRMTQSMLAAALGVSFQQVQKYENGTNRMTADRLRLAAHALQVPLSHLVGEEEAGRSEGFAEDGATYTPDVAPTRNGQALIKAFREIADAEIQRKLIELVEAIARSSKA